MIGVDIIDLSCSFNQSKYSLQDYMNRILNKSEYSFCGTNIDLEILWAIKESAYKCHFKQTHISFLNPKKILVTRFDKNSNLFNVQIGERFYTGNFKVTENYVYSICFDNDSSNNKTEIFIDSNGGFLKSTEEFDFFFKKSEDLASFSFHPTGFPDSIRFKAHYYPYSRSQHGSWYISAIMPNRNN